jgi:hypothetical protein
LDPTIEDLDENSRGIPPTVFNANAVSYPTNIIKFEHAIKSSNAKQSNVTGKST